MLIFQTFEFAVSKSEYYSKILEMIIIITTLKENKCSINKLAVTRYSCDDSRHKLSTKRETLDSKFTLTRVFQITRDRLILYETQSTNTYKHRKTMDQHRQGPLIYRFPSRVSRWVSLVLLGFPFPGAPDLNWRNM